MKQFIQECDGVASLCNIDLAKIPIYDDVSCINADIAAGCLTEGQLVANPACADPVPLVGTADTVLIRTPSSGYVGLVSNVGGSYGCVISTPMTYVCATDTLNVTNLTATGCINGIPYNCYAQLCDIPSVSGFVTSTDLTTCLNDYETSAALTTCLSDYVTSTTLSSCLGDYVTSTALSNCCYATETCACSLAEDCACAYFEGCFADCFTCCIAEWWACHKGEIESSAQTDNNRLWVI